MCLFYPNIHSNHLAMVLSVVHPYVGMARKQNGGYNASTIAFKR